MSKMAENKPSSQPMTIRRIVYHEITEGDRRKIIASSNDAGTGGGARDLRFSPYERFEDVFSRLFSNKRIVSRLRNKVRTDVTIFVGQLNWYDNGTLKKIESAFEPPTDSRPFEGRITQVNKYPFFANVPDTSQGVVLLILIQDVDEAVWPYFETKTSLENPNWNRSVADKLLACITAKRSGNAVAGYIDFETKSSFCNGD